MNQTGESFATLQVSRGNAPQEWDRYCAELRAGYYISRGFADAVANEGDVPVYFVLGSRDQSLGIALGFLTNQWRRWPARLLTRGFRWQTHPVVKDGDSELLESFVRGIVAEIERLGVSRIKLHSEDARLSPGGLADDGFVATDRIEFMVGLSKDPSDVIARMRKHKRAYVKAAIRSGRVQVREESSVGAVRQLIDFQETSRERRRRRGEDYAIANASAAEAIYRAYVEPGHGRVFLSYLADQPETALSGIMLHCFGGRAYYTMSGCSEAGFVADAQLMTLWGAIERLCAEAYSEINLGGVSASAANPNDLGHGLYSFKRSFGGDEIRCVTWEKPCDWFGSRVAHVLGLATSADICSPKGTAPTTLVRSAVKPHASGQAP